MRATVQVHQMQSPGVYRLVHEKVFTNYREALDYEKVLRARCDVHLMVIDIIVRTEEGD